jgi:sorbitol/mannitol transport system substrate-binding protein
MANSFGARWFDENWKPQFNSEAWAETLNYYVKLMQSYGQRGASKMGFTETLSLFQKGKCAIWIDATVAGAAVINPQESEVAEHVGFAMAPDNGLSKRANWLWTWSLAIPSSSTKSDAAQKFISWATSKSYIALVANKKGWANVPPGTRLSLYENPSYTSVAPFAQITLESINTADPLNPTVQPVPYVGVQFIAIPEYQGIGNAVGEQFSAAVAGEITVEEALEGAQRLTQRAMQNAGYMK